MAVAANPWPGPVAIWRSSDGLSFQRAATALAPATIGETLDPLSSGPTGRFDRGSRMRVRLYTGMLTSVSDAALLNGANAAAVRAGDGGWEILQFGNAELVADRTYELSRFLRGQMGTEHAIANPLPVGADFVLLDQNVVSVASGLDALERTVELRVIATSRDYGDPSAVTLQMTPQPTALKPLSPVHLRARRNGSGVTFEWIRRSRFEADSWVGEVPLGEDREAYAVDVLNGAAVVRTIESALPAAHYAAADEIADFGAAQASLTIRVAQLSATVGRGFAAQATLTP
jgi:hypothetical protein